MRRWPWLMVLATIAFDRWTKHLIETRLTDLDVIPVVPHLVQIVRVHNTGVAFSMFAELGAQGGRLILIAITCAVLLLVLNLLWNAARNQREHPLQAAALALICGGAAGNLWDRIAQGSVTDFIDCYWGASHFPVFNVADSAITVGAGLLIIQLWMVQPKRTTTASGERGDQTRGSE